MTTMSANSVHVANENLTVLAGERVRVQILNADGTQKTLVQDLEVPAVKTFTGRTLVSGTLA